VYIFYKILKLVKRVNCFIINYNWNNISTINKTSQKCDIQYETNTDQPWLCSSVFLMRKTCEIKYFTQGEQIHAVNQMWFFKTCVVSVVRRWHCLQNVEDFYNWFLQSDFHLSTNVDRWKSNHDLRIVIWFQSFYNCKEAKLMWSYLFHMMHLPTRCEMPVGKSHVIQCG